MKTMLKSKTDTMKKSMLALAVAIVLTGCHQNDTKKMKKLPANVPVTAVWKGGADEGFWFDILDISSQKNTIRFRLYDDFDGQLALEADFSATSCQDILAWPKQKILADIFVLEDYDIILNNDCHLTIIRPILDGRMKE